MKYKAILMFVVVPTIFAAVAQAQYTPSLMPPRTAHPSAGKASINVKSDSLAPPQKLVPTPSPSPESSTAS